MWVALLIALATVMVLLNTMNNITKVPFDQWWAYFTRTWQVRFVALIPLLGAVLLLHPRLPQGRFVRWGVLGTMVLLAATIALICQDLWRRFVMGAGIPPLFVPFCGTRIS